MAQGIRDQSLRRAVTIKHVAAEAGVSLQTVSRVINNEPNVRPVVQERVRAAVAKLGYVPSLAARRMGGSRSYLLMALNDRDRTIEGWKSGEGTDWVDQMLMGGMLKCEAHGYRMIFELVDTHSDHVDAAVRGAIAALHPDGVARGTRTRPDGTFGLPGLAPGTYRLVFIDPTSTHPIAWFDDATNHDGSATIDVTADASIALPDQQLP